jgi:D-glycero-D-manno-heptose 1,7-bisphosphate phosphatase
MARVLLCQHVKKGYVYLPGGHVEFGETGAQALAREMMEEAGVRVRVGALRHVHEHAFVQKDDEKQEINLTYAAHLEGQREGEVEGQRDGRQHAAMPDVRSQEKGIAFTWLTAEEVLGADMRPASMRAWVCEAMSASAGVQERGHEPGRGQGSDSMRTMSIVHEVHATSRQRPAVFLDRDGTIIREVHYIAKPEQVELLPGAAEAIVALRRAGFACVMVSNQSGVGRQMVSHEAMWRVQAEVRRQLAEQGASLDGVYFCPVAPPADADGAADRRSRIDHPDRKPAPGMLLRAACELGLEVEQSWMVGDMLSDVLAGQNAGCRGTIHVRTGHGASQPEASEKATFSAENLAEAARMVVLHGQEA